jgi:lipoprotein LprG
MKHIIPSSAGDSFTVEWQVTEDAELREAAMTGIFYPKSTEMTYTVSFANYGTEKDIAAP